MLRYKHDMFMENRIREYVEELFKDAPYTQQVYELKVELIQNLIDKYYDLINEGKSPEDAYNLTILGIGDIDELIDSVDSGTSYYNYGVTTTRKKKSAALISAAVMLYILSVVPLIIFESIGIDSMVGLVLMFVMVAAATGMIIYNSMTRPKYNAQPETVVEDFRQWQQNKSGSKRVYKAVMSAYWPICLALYFLLSFTTGRWNITWIIFLISPAVSSIIKAVFELKDH